MPLGQYKRKRQFGSTPEPAGKAKPKANQRLRFVVHRHNASHLHYDLRLELDGVLKSWAVPKGPSLDPHTRRLAIQVEDHPIEYLKFKGTIPKGNYGAGEVVIWDSGTYQPRAETADATKTLRSELRKGHITFVVHGRKLKGEFALIQSPHMGEHAWLLIKKGDEFAKHELIGQTKTVPRVNLAADLTAAPKKSLLTSVQPMLATLVDEPFDDPSWLFEIKWDGYRAIGSQDGTKTQLYSRNGMDFSTQYPEVIEAMHALKNSVVLDGEIVALNKKGLAEFEWLQNYRTNPLGELRYYVFDLLWCDGHDVRQWQLQERRELLKSLLPKDSLIQYSDEIIGKGKSFYAQAAKKNLEGIMAKRQDSTYAPGKRSKAWLKIKTHLRQEVVIGGFTEPRGSRKDLGALVVGVYKNGKLQYCGHVGGGFSTEQLGPLRKQLQKLEIAKSPFDSRVKTNAPVHWVRPKLLCEVQFGEWTSDGQMRQPIFMGMRVDKNPRVVHKEVAQKVVISKGTRQTDKLEFTHLDKVFWPEAGFTKGDLLTYYQTVAPTLLPYLKDRPESMRRQPDGYKGMSFFQKDIASIAPKWAETITLHSNSAGRDITYLLCNSQKALEYMVQLGVIEINPWNSRTQKLHKPDWVVIDLDPEGVSFEKVIEVAKVVKQVCDSLKIPSYPKTSGKTGIHTYIPLGARYTNDQARTFGQILATLIHKQIPTLTSIIRNPQKRHRKVYLDYLQNSEGQTLAAPYCVRPTKAASVSTPLHWHEVKKGLSPDTFTIKTTPARIKKVGDLFKPVLGKGIDLISVIKRAEKL